MFIRLADVSQRFRGRVALDAITLDIPAGVCGLVGANGSGKTTLLRLLATRLAPSAGRVWLDERDLALPAARLAARRELGYVPQELALPGRLRGWDWLEEIALLKGERQATQRRRSIEAAVDAVRLGERAWLPIARLSAGERRRLVIAQALLAAPRCLLLDEPLAGLDAAERRDLMNELLSVPGRSVICATHLTEEWLARCATCVVLRAGRVAYAGAVTNLLATSGASTPATAIWTIITGGATAPERTIMNATPAPATAAGLASDGEGLTIRVTNLGRRFGASWAVRGVNLTMPPGVFGLLGRNGAGKTTLLQLIATLLEPTEGQVQVGPYDARRDPWAIRRRLGYLPQEHGFYPAFTVRETLRYFAGLQGIRHTAPAVERAMTAVNLAAEARTRVGALSGGMRRRLGLAQALLGEPAILIVDEPTAGLDPVEQQRFRALLGALAAGADRTILLSTHIIEDIETAARQVAVLERGRVLFSGEVAALRERARDRAWLWHAPLAEVEARRAAGVSVTSITPLAGQPGLVEARTVGDSPALMCAPREPTLTDGYFVVLAEGARP